MTLVEPPPVTQSVINALLDLSTCVCNELATTGGGETCWCGLYPGQAVSWDYCGECDGAHCGMGWVRLAGIVPYTVFPNPEIDARCTLPLAWAVEVGSLRCIPQPSTGELASPEEMLETAVIQALDASALHRAIKCCGIGVAVQQWTPLGPLGGCVGGSWLAYVAVD